MIQADAAEELRILEEQEQQGMAMGEALLKVQEGLVNGSKWLWDEAARKLGTLLSSPAAFEGEHFLQVFLSACNPHLKPHWKKGEALIIGQVPTNLLVHL